jgi:hypothetical protein
MSTDTGDRAIANLLASRDRISCDPAEADGRAIRSPEYAWSPRPSANALAVMATATGASPAGGQLGAGTGD